MRHPADIGLATIAQAADQHIQKRESSSGAGSSLDECKSVPLPAIISPAREDGEARPNDESMPEVRENDVLCGRGGTTNRHPGNVRFRSLVQQERLRYLQAHRLCKADIASQIVHEVRRCGGRFLKKCPTSSSWVDIGDSKAREKTSQALREGLPQRRYRQVNNEGSVAVAHYGDTHGVLGLLRRRRSDSQLPCKKRRLHHFPLPEIDAVPTDRDIVFGKGKAIQDHPGNVRFRSIVNTHRERYQAAKRKSEKSRICYEVVRLIRTKGGRFLQSNSMGKFSDAEDKKVKDKVSHALRNQRKYCNVSLEQGPDHDEDSGPERD